MNMTDAEMAEAVKCIILGHLYKELSDDGNYEYWSQRCIRCGFDQQSILQLLKINFTTEIYQPLEIFDDQKS